MYIHEYLGDPAPLGQVFHPRSWRPPPPTPKLSFFSLDQFEWSHARLTKRLKDLVALLANTIRMSQKTPNPVGIVTLKGFTDSTGPETFNRNLGDWRAGEVQKELLTLLGPEILAKTLRIQILIEPSTGPRPRRVDPERTDADRASNRRVEVYFAPPPPTPDPPPPPPCLKLNNCKPPPLPPDPDPDWFRRIPRGPRGKSIRDWLCGVLGNCTLADLFIKGGCRGLEELITRAGGDLSDDQKDELRSRCTDAANKPWR